MRTIYCVFGTTPPPHPSQHWTPDVLHGTPQPFMEPPPLPRSAGHQVSYTVPQQPLWKCPSPLSCSQGCLVFAYTWKCGQRSRCTHTIGARTFVSVVVCVARKLRPCPSYSGRRDRNNSVHWRSLYKGGGGMCCCVGVCCLCCLSNPWTSLGAGGGGGERERFF